MVLEFFGPNNGPNGLEKHPVFLIRPKNETLCPKYLLK